MSALYVWELFSGWEALTTEEALNESRRTTSAMVAWSQPILVELRGLNVAAGAMGTLRYSFSDPIGTLTIHSMPALPPTQVYQLWCYGPSSEGDASTTFSVSMDSDDTTYVQVAAPKLFRAYVRFQITVEPSPGSNKPTGPAVMTN